MLVIRLFRVGKKNQPSFKIVVIDKRKATNKGRFVEEVGFLNPLTKEKILRKERIEYWLSVGAKPSETLHNLLVKEGIIEGKKIPKHKKAKKKETEATQAPSAEGGDAGQIKEESKPEEKKEEVISEEKPKEEEKPVKEPEAPKEEKKEVKEIKEGKPSESEKPAEEPKKVEAPQVEAPEEPKKIEAPESSSDESSEASKEAKEETLKEEGA